MKIALGADHGGFATKEDLAAHLRRRGHRILDVGAFDLEPTDYPDAARRLAKAVVSGKAARGVLVCGTGIGMSIAANKVKGIRAAVVWSRRTAALAAQHNGANVLCLGGRVLSRATARQLVDVWLATSVESGRHRRRRGKITALENDPLVAEDPSPLGS